MNKIVRVLIIGLGSIGRRHFEIAIKKFPDADIKVLRHTKDNKGSKQESSFYKLEDAISFDPQVVVISNPASLHISSAKPFIEKDRYFFIEKPLSNDVKEAKDFLEICNKENAIVQIGYNMRFLSSLKAFKQFIDEDLIGDIWSIRAEIGQYLPSWRSCNDYSLSVSSQSSLGGGVVNELSHELDYLLWIFGDIKWVRAITSKQSNLDIDVEDSAFILMGFEKHSNKNLIASLNMDFIRHDRKRECIVIGSKGSIKWNGLKGTVELYKKDDKSWEELFSLQDLEQSYDYEWEDLEISYINNSQPSVNGFEGLRTLNIINEVKKSSELGGMIIEISN